MLHKKSEYRLQYCKLNKEIRRQIWQDNIALRKSRLMSNQATHYWEYQLRDGDCSCECGTEDEEDEGPLPPNRQKHKYLREQYKNQVEKVQPQQLATEHKDACEIAIQTPEWNGDNCVDGVKEEELVRHMSSLSLPKPKTSSSKSPTPRVRPRTATSLTQPSRANRKQQMESRRTHFVPYGWNETNTDVGHKQTYNVCAPEKEVHDSAILTAQRKKAEVNLFLGQEKKVKRHTRSREKATSSKSNNMWVSEYQEQFSARSSRNSRPLSAPPAPRQPVTWRHS